MKPVHLIFLPSGALYCSTSGIEEKSEIYEAGGWKSMGYGPVVKVWKDETGWHAEEV